MTWHEERERLLNSRISELGLRIEGTELEPLVEQLYRELDACGIAFKPQVYLSDEWGCPEGVPVIGVPFYLADPKLSAIENELAENLESRDESMMYLRHEAGHAFNYAYRLYEREEWHALFGPYSRPYVDAYKPNPVATEFVRHIAGWYAQKHPDEDFAETFAVWLDPQSSWREAYAGTPALRKIRYVDRVARELGSQPPLVTPSRRDAPVEEMMYTVAEHYNRQPAPSIKLPQWFDGDLRRIFAAEGSEPAAAMLRAKRKRIVGEVAYWTGVQPHVVRALADHLIGRVAALNLCTRDDSLVAFVATLTTLAMNTLHEEG
ncbi:MAG TPA: putative zinc-binding metallopeptidase [Thermoanaerobaculia bacterium]|nr:putative zinc-binding metallopeptidase [Thermoanaerobaculia bacterium]